MPKIILDVFLGANGNPIIARPASTSPGNVPTLYSGDKTELTLRFWSGSQGDAVLTNAVLDTGAIVRFGSKVNKSDVHCVLFASNFTSTTEGNYTTYTAPLELNNSELAAALSTSDEIAVWSDIEITYTSGTRQTYQFKHTIKRDVLTQDSIPPSSLYETNPGATYFTGLVTCGQGATFNGNVDFSGATVTGLELGSTFNPQAVQVTLGAIGGGSIIRAGGTIITLLTDSGIGCVMAGTTVRFGITDGGSTPLSLFKIEAEQTQINNLEITNGVTGYGFKQSVFSAIEDFENIPTLTVVNGPFPTMIYCGVTVRYRRNGGAWTVAANAYLEVSGTYEIQGLYPGGLPGAPLESIYINVFADYGIIELIQVPSTTVNLDLGQSPITSLPKLPATLHTLNLQNTMIGTDALINIVHQLAMMGAQPGNWVSIYSIAAFNDPAFNTSILNSAINAGWTFYYSA